jgi:cbb3-type cytochrome c oxidase subunit II
MYQFTELSKRYPEEFREAFVEPDVETCAEALRLGRQVYIGEGCWHCHSQFVRPVSNESQRYGAVSEAWEYQNELQRPVMFGTRRVGPDLSREGGRHANDWHTVHFFRPKMIVPDSPMPEYPWLFDGDPSKPNKRGLALITYVQWLGSWLDSYPYYEELESIQSEGY